MESLNSFTNGLWQGITDTYAKILESDYVQNMANGTLNKRCFQYFIEQDIIYLNNDSEILKILAKRSDNKRYSDFFNTLAQDSITSEKNLNRQYSKPLKSKAVLSSSAFKTYIDFMTEQINNAPYPVAVTSKLPCYMIYTELGLYFRENIKKGNEYEEFAKSYASTEYIRFTNEFISIVDELGVKSSVEIQSKMKEVFNISARHELAVFQECGSVN